MSAPAEVPDDIMVVLTDLAAARDALGRAYARVVARKHDLDPGDDLAREVSLIAEAAAFVVDHAERLLGPQVPKGLVTP